MSAQSSTVTVRFKPNESALDPDDPLDTACSRTLLGGGFTPAIREAAVAEAQATRLTLSIGASLNGGRARTLSSSTGSGVAGQLSAQVQAGFDEQADPGIRFAADAFCRDYIRTLCWQPWPIDWPQLHPAQILVAETAHEITSADEPAVWIDALWDGQTGIVYRHQTDYAKIDDDLVVAWPENIASWVRPSPYSLLIADAIDAPSGKTEPGVFVIGPEFVDDPVGSPVAVGASVIGAHGTRVPYRYVVVDNDDGARATVIEETAFPRGVLPLQSQSPSISGNDAFLLGLAAMDGRSALLSRSFLVYELMLEILPAYGRVHFAAGGFCENAEPVTWPETTDGQPTPDVPAPPQKGLVLADQWSAFQRPEKLTDFPVSTTCVMNVHILRGFFQEEWNTDDYAYDLSLGKLSISGKFPASDLCGGTGDGTYYSYSANRYLFVNTATVISAITSCKLGYGGARATLYEVEKQVDGYSQGDFVVLERRRGSEETCSSGQSTYVDMKASETLYPGKLYELQASAWGGSKMPIGDFEVTFILEPVPQDAP